MRHPSAARAHEAERLPGPIFTPATKNEKGHDENIPFARMADAVGTEEAQWLRATTLSLYARARDEAQPRGLLLADTKLEFGRWDGRLIWIDEAFTPDSSRYWDAALYRPGKNPVAYDKQFVRDWLGRPAGTRSRLPRACRRASSHGEVPEAYRLLTGTPPRHLTP